MCSSGLSPGRVARAIGYSPRMRVGVDVRPALHQETGVGRYLLGLLPALAASGITVRALSSSLRGHFAPARLPGCEVVNRRIPVRALDAMWRRAAWPSFEFLAGAVDVTHSPTPLPLPSRRAAHLCSSDWFPWLQWDGADANAHACRLYPAGVALGHAAHVCCRDARREHVAHRVDRHRTGHRASHHHGARIAIACGADRHVAARAVGRAGRGAADAAGHTGARRFAARVFVEGCACAVWHGPHVARETWILQFEPTVVPARSVQAPTMAR